MATHYHIMGGGIAGLCTALGLQQQDLPYTLYEKGSGITYEKVGLGISRNIYPIFAEWGILDKIRDLGKEVENLVMVDKNLKPLRSFYFKSPALAVDRERFYDILAGELQPANIQLGRDASFEDFPQPDVVIAAEGAYSSSRRKLYPHIPLRQSRQTLWRGIASLKLDKSYHHNYYDFIGAPIRFAIIHTGNDLYSWYAIGENLSEELKNAVNVKEMLLELLRDFSPVVREIISHTPKIYRDELTDIDPVNRKGIKWYTRNMVMIGDAIHPTTPNMANGACLAMEDAYVVSKLLKKYPKTPETAFQQYQQLREPKVNRIVKQSWALGKLMHPQHKLVNSLMLASTRFTPQWAFDLVYSAALNDKSLRQANAETV